MWEGRGTGGGAGTNSFPMDQAITQPNASPVQDLASQLQDMNLQANPASLGKMPVFYQVSHATRMFRVERD